MTIYTYDHFKHDIHSLRDLCEPFKADAILAVARGGMSLAHALAMSLDIRNLQSIRIESYDGDRQRDHVTILGECDFTNCKRVLVVDDIVDSGATLAALIPLLKTRHPKIDFKVAALFTKFTAQLQPDFYLHEATDWIDFFWERDFLKSNSL